MADYDYSVTIAGTGTTLANTGNPPLVWDQGGFSYVLQYEEANLRVQGPEDYADIELTGTKQLSNESLAGTVGEMAVDAIYVHRVSEIGTIVEFWFNGECNGSMTLVDGVGEEYINEAKMVVECTLTWSDPV